MNTTETAPFQLTGSSTPDSESDAVLLADDGQIAPSDGNGAGFLGLAAMREWERIASDADMHLPQFSTPLTTGHMERWLRRLGISRDQYLAWNGAGLNGNGSSAKLSDFIVRNPGWTFREWAGLVLEHRDLILREANP